MTIVDTQRDRGHGLDFLAEPTLVVALDGRIIDANVAAREFFGRGLEARQLSDLLRDEAGTCGEYLRLASGSPSPRPGKYTFAGTLGAREFRTQAARSRQSAGGVQVVLRLLPLASERFPMLDRRVRDLDAKLRNRLLENAALRETLRQNRTLLRELQHRVKNNVQMMMSLIKMAAQDRDTPEVAEVVEISRGRLQAMAAVQEALYQAAEIERVPARSFLADVLARTARSNGIADRLSLSLSDGDLSSETAHCLALIANELITNSAKHGTAGAGGPIAVTFADENGGYRLTVDDGGRGISAAAATRSSGLSLVRGLCRQIGGRFEIGGAGEATCSVWFPADRTGNEEA